MEFHQRDRAGNGRIVETMTRYFRMPTSFEKFVYLSQLQQALAIETAVRYWRSLKPHCMGTLYWQLNDVWPAVSWSSLDHAIGWKTLHYHARRFYAPLAIAARIDGDRLRITGLNDRHAPATLDVRVRRIGVDGGIRDETALSGTIPPDRATEIGSVSFTPRAGEVFIIDARPTDAPGFDPAMRLTVFADKPKRSDLPEATIVLAAVPGSTGVFTLAADKPAYFVKPEASEFAGAFDDASFTLLPGETRTIAFRSFDGRMPKAADIVVDQLAATYR